MSRSRPFVALLLVAAFVTTQVAGAAGDTREQREEVRRQQAAVAADVDVLEARDAEIAAALDTLAANLAAEEAALAAAEAEVARADDRLAAARAAERRLVVRIEDLEEDMRNLAVEAYIGTSRTDRLGLVLTADDPAEGTHRAALADSVAVDLDDVVDELELAKERLVEVREDAEVAAAQAESSRQAVEARLADLRVARDQHAALAADVEARIEARLAEAQALASIDATLSAAIQAEEAELARRTAAALAAAARSRVAYTPVPAPPLRSVGGITVHADIADALGALLAAAAEDGIVLRGGGYRDPAQQWALRVQNCPDPSLSPASACSPPTARPGTSNHERGLAVDFTNDGASITTRDNPAFLWLAEHAADYGFHNLPSEPWHWSVDGS